MAFDDRVAQIGDRRLSRARISLFGSDFRYVTGARRPGCRQRLPARDHARRVRRAGEALPRLQAELTLDMWTGHRDRTAVQVELDTTLLFEPAHVEGGADHVHLIGTCLDEPSVALGLDDVDRHLSIDQIHSRAVGRDFADTRTSSVGELGARAVGECDARVFVADDVAVPECTITDAITQALLDVPAEPKQRSQASGCEHRGGSKLTPPRAANAMSCDALRERRHELSLALLVGSLGAELPREQDHPLDHRVRLGFRVHGSTPLSNFDT